MTPQHRVAVISSSNHTALSDKLTGNIGKIFVFDCGYPEDRKQEVDKGDEREGEGKEGREGGREINTYWSSPPLLLTTEMLES